MVGRSLLTKDLILYETGSFVVHCALLANKPPIASKIRHANIQSLYEVLVPGKDSHMRLSNFLYYLMDFLSLFLGYISAGVSLLLPPFHSNAVAAPVFRKTKSSLLESCRQSEVICMGACQGMSEHISFFFFPRNTTCSFFYDPLAGSCLRAGV